MRRLRRHRGDEGAIAVLAGVVIPVVLVVVAIAFATLVWGASETELQRSSDEASEQAAANLALVDFPYSSLTALSSTAYPTLQSQLVSQLTAPTRTACSTIGNPVGATSGLLANGGVLGPVLTGLGIGQASALTSAVAALPATLSGALSSLPTSCTGLGPVPAFPAVPASASTTACAQAAAGLDASAAPYSNRFFDGPSSDAQPTCANQRVRVAFATGSPLLGFGSSGVTVGNQLQLTAASGVSAVQNSLAPLGVHLDTALPETLCPQVNVEVDQPVRSPVVPKTSTTTGRSSAKRVMKNAVIVPVFNGLALPSVPGSSPAVQTVDGLGASANGVITPAGNLNTFLLQPLQKQLLSVLDALNTSINTKLAADNVGVVGLSGTVSSISVTATPAAPLPAVAGNVSTLNLLSCLRSTLTQVYDPPTGDAPTVAEVLSQAADAREPVQLVEVGVQPCSTATTAADALSCVAPAVQQTAATALNKATGLYDVPFLDVAPAMVEDIGNGNFLAVPVHASQASGAFRASLVRSTDERYAP